MSETDTWREACASTIRDKYLASLHRIVRRSGFDFLDSKGGHTRWIDFIRAPSAWRKSEPLLISGATSKIDGDRSRMRTITGSRRAVI